MLCHRDEKSFWINKGEKKLLLALSEHYIHNDLCAYVGIEAGGKLAALHVKLLAKHGGSELHVERLVADGEVFGIARYHGPHHMFPALDEAILVERSFEPLLAEVLTYEVAYGFGVGAAHGYSVRR